MSKSNHLSPEKNTIKIDEETFRSAMEYASIGMALVDLNGAWLKVNRSVCELLGYTEDELMQIDFQSITHPEDLGQDLQFVQQLLNKQIKTYQMEKRYFHKDGHIIWVLLSVSLIWGNDDQPKYFISQLQDVTRQKQADRIKSEFISVVSHELRTPLTSIRGSLGLVANKIAGELPDKANRLIQIAYENSERLILLINDILDIDKIASGKMRFDLQEENLVTVLQKSIDSNQSYADKFGVSIKLVTNHDHVNVRIDEARLMQVLSNLLSNASKFSPENDVITVSLSISDEMAHIIVKDNGPGIPESFKSKIFERFSQADSSLTRSKGGTGLGLHISREIIDHMNGKIGFNEDAAQGAEFWIQLPLAGAVMKAFEIDKQDLIVKVKPASKNLPKILHIEDDVSLIDFFTNALADKADVIGATTFAKANELLEKSDFTMIILDMVMPDGLGSDFLEELQQTSQRNVPVMILSGLEAPETIKKRVTAYMVKSRMSETRIIEEILNLLQSEDGRLHA
jgi:PAS domain S-box-containing protein